MANLLSTSINGTLKVDSAAGSNRGFTFKENGGTEWALIPLTSSTLDLGSQTLPFRNVYANNFKLTSNTSSVDLENAEKIDTSTFMQVSDDNTGKTSKIILGNETVTSEAAGRAGQILLYGTGKGGTILETKQSGDISNTISLPSKTGTVSLEGHSHAFKTTDFIWKVPTGKTSYTQQNSNIATGTLYTVIKDEKSKKYVLSTAVSDANNLTIKNCYGWGSDFLDVFVIRGYATFKPKTNIDPYIRLRIASITAKEGYLPSTLTPLAIYTHNKKDLKGFIGDIVNNNNGTETAYIDIRYDSSLTAGKTYVLYFTATYGRIADTTQQEDETTDDE